MILISNVPIKEDQVDAARAARNLRERIKFTDKHGVVKDALVLEVEYRLPPQGVGRGWFIDVAMDGDTGIVDDVLHKIEMANKR
jgi:hypothetical protein